MRARDIMTTPVVTVTPVTPIKEAAATLAGNGFTALPVVDAGDRLIGIVTEADIAVLARALLDAGHRSMPIVDGSRVVGIVTRRDIVRVIARDDQAIAEDVRHRLAIYGGDRRWRVEVHEGMVTIGDQFDDETDRHVATVLAEAVPGVVRATAFAVRDEDDR